MVMRLRLIKKLAERIDGIDLSAYKPGDVVDLTQSEGRLLLAERWAVTEDGAGLMEGRRQYGASGSHLTAPPR